MSTKNPQPKPRYTLVQAREIVVGDFIVSSVPSGVFRVAAIETRQILHTPSANNELYFMLANNDGLPVGSACVGMVSWVWRRGR